MMRKAPLRHDATTTRNNARHAIGGKWNKAQQHASVNREIIHALLGLLDEGVAVNFPSEIFGLAADFFEGLINWHGSDRHW